MKLLFIDEEYHLKTKSADFFLNILREEFDVETHYHKGGYLSVLPEEKITRADVVVIWQNIIGRHDFVVPGKPCVLVPMYDADWGSRAMWRRIVLSGTHVISFSNGISNRAKRAGIRSDHFLDIRFAFNPDDFHDAKGDERAAAIWERGEFDFDTVKRLFTPGLMKKIMIFRRPQPNLSYSPISDEDKRKYCVEIDQRQFIPKDEYVEKAKEYGIYVAPRPREGIGMSFLEQLAMGKCVIAHDDSTMNEYIEDGKSGILRNFFGNFPPVTADEIARARMGVASAAKKAFSRWLTDKTKIVPFIKAVAERPPVKIGGLEDSIFRLFYIVEAATSRFIEKVKPL